MEVDDGFRDQEPHESLVGAHEAVRNDIRSEFARESNLSKSFCLRLWLSTVYPRQWLPMVLLGSE